MTASKILPLIILPLGLILISLGVAFLFDRKKPSLSRGLLVIAFVLALVPSLPVVSNSLWNYIEQDYGIPDLEGVSKHDLVVVLSGYISAEASVVDRGVRWGDPDRFFMGVRVHSVTKAPLLLMRDVASGPDLIARRYVADELLAKALAMGVDKESVLLSDFVENTAKEAIEVRKELTRLGGRKIFLVTSAFHMKRAVMLFESEGITVTPVPTDFRGQEFYWASAFFVPNAHAFFQSSEALREILGRMYYAARMWGAGVLHKEKNDSPSYWGTRNTNCLMSPDGTFEQTANEHHHLPYKFDLMTDKAPYSPRDGAATAVHEDNLILVGGWTTDRPFSLMNDVYISRDGREWSEFEARQEASFTPQHLSNVIIHNGRYWLIGGDYDAWDSKKYVNSIYVSDDALRWTLVDDSPPWEHRIGNISFSLGGYMFVMGGQKSPEDGCRLESSCNLFFNDIWRSRDGISWEQVPLQYDVGGPRFVSRGFIYGKFTLNGYVYLIGGHRVVTSKSESGQIEQFDANFSDVWRSKNGSFWELVAAETDVPWSDFPTSFATISVFDKRLWRIGGGSTVFGNTKAIYVSNDGRNWMEIACTPNPVTHAVAVWARDKELFIGPGNDLENYVWRISRL